MLCMVPTAKSSPLVKGIYEKETDSVTLNGPVKVQKRDALETMRSSARLGTMNKMYQWLLLSRELDNYIILFPGRRKRVS